MHVLFPLPRFCQSLRWHGHCFVCADMPCASPRSPLFAEPSFQRSLVNFFAPDFLDHTLRARDRTI